MSSLQSNLEKKKKNMCEGNKQIWMIKVWQIRAWNDIPVWQEALSSDRLSIRPWNQHKHDEKQRRPEDDAITDWQETLSEFQMQ